MDIRRLCNCRSGTACRSCRSCSGPSRGPRTARCTCAGTSLEALLRRARWRPVRRPGPARSSRTERRPPRRRPHPRRSSSPGIPRATHKLTKSTRRRRQGEGPTFASQHLPQAVPCHRRRRGADPRASNHVPQGTPGIGQAHGASLVIGASLVMARPRVIEAKLSAYAHLAARPAVGGRPCPTQPAARRQSRSLAHAAVTSCVPYARLAAAAAVVTISCRVDARVRANQEWTRANTFAALTMRPVRAHVVACTAVV